MIRKFKLVVLPVLIILSIIWFNVSLRFNVKNEQLPITKVKAELQGLLKQPSADINAIQGKSTITLVHRAIGEDSKWTFVPNNSEEYQQLLRLIGLIEASKINSTSMNILGAYRVSVKTLDSELEFSFSQGYTESNPALRNFVRLIKQFGKQEK
jgi:hypothetical protein